MRCSLECDSSSSQFIQWSKTPTSLIIYLHHCRYNGEWSCLHAYICCLLLFLCGLLPFLYIEVLQLIEFSPNFCRWGGTLMNSFLFNVGLILLSSIRYLLYLMHPPIHLQHLNLLLACQYFVPGHCKLQRYPIFCNCFWCLCWGNSSSRYIWTYFGIFKRH